MNLRKGDDELVERLRAGDITAFDELYHKYNIKVYYFSLKYLHIDEEARDLVQIVFLKIWDNRDILKKECCFHSYLFTICYNEICKLFRKRSYQLKFLQERLKEDLNSGNEEDDGLHYKAILSKVYQYMNKLPENHKNAFLKSRVEGKSTREIASEMHLSPGTVDNYVSDVQKFLKSKFKDLIIIH